MSEPQIPRRQGPLGLAQAALARREADLRRLFGNQLFGPTDPARDAGWTPEPRRPISSPNLARAGATMVEVKRKGFFTDTSICIGCKACEVACKEWNGVPPRPEADAHGHASAAPPAEFGSSYDNTGHLGADTWRHVAFVEQGPDRLAAARESGRRLLTITPVSHARNLPPTQAAAAASSLVNSETTPGADDLPPVRWLMSSDVCKHCTHAGCLDVCPTGALFRTEFGTVVVQDDVCNGCGYCVAACPFGVIGRRRSGTVTIGSSTEPIKNPGVAQKCTLCYDRIGVGLQPACAKTCPTTSITFGDHDDMVVRARDRLAELHAQGRTEARLYGANPDDGVGGTGSVFLLLDDPEVYGLPPDPVVTTRDLPAMFAYAGIAGTVLLGAVVAVFGAAFGRGR